MTAQTVPPAIWRSCRQGLRSVDAGPFLFSGLCGLLLMLGATGARASADRAATPPGAPAASVMPALDMRRLEPRGFLQLLVARNLEVQFSRLNSDVTRHLASSEAGLYEPVFFASVRREDRFKQQTIEEIRLYNAASQVLDERVNTVEGGIRGKLPTGADLSLSYRKSSKNNNLIPLSTFGFYNTEYSNLLTLTLKQPLLRGFGRAVTETDARIADLEHRTSLQQLMQQTLKTSLEGLNLYWQLHRSQETVRLRQEALATSKALGVDTQARITAGRTPASAMLELGGVDLNRQAELLRGQQQLRESQGKLSTALNVAWNQGEAAATQPRLSRPETGPQDRQPSIDDMLEHWTPYQIALLRREQAQVRLDFARNQIKPALDFVMNYGKTGLGYNAGDARRATSGGQYPDWYVGLNLEVPLGGNQKAREQFLAQASRLQQAELELESVRSAFVNDVQVRLDDLKNARAVLKLSADEVQLRQTIFENERTRVQIGSGLPGALIQKQSDLIEAQQRLLESQVRYEIALASWQYTRGTLLSDNGIQVIGQAASP